MRMAPQSRACVILTVAAVVVAASAAPFAVTPQVVPTVQTAPPSGRVVITVGRSTVLPTDFEIARFAVTNPAIADALVVSPREVLIDGKAPGTVSLIVWGRAAERRQFDIVVDPGVSELQQQLQAIFPGEDIKASITADAVILTGRVSTNDVMLRSAEIAAAMAPKSKIINLLDLPGGSSSQQVELQVRVAEVNRRALQELGTSLFTGATGYKDFIARSTTQQFAAPAYDNLQRTEANGQVTGLSGDITFSDFLNLFVYNTKYNVGTLIRALQTSGNFQSLAEPNLIAYNGKEASFLAGGELPIPIVQGNTNSVSIEYKEFGIRLKFTPTIAGDVIKLHVAPEVSALDFANGITLNGFRIPALTTRRAETDVELRDGQSFAIAGLINNVAQETKQSVPLLSRIPLIGYLFKSRAVNRDRTELMVLVTPRLVRPSSPDDVPPLPTDDSAFIPADAGSARRGATPPAAPR